MKTKNMNYVDGFLIVIKKKDIGKYKKMAEWGAKSWMRHGALEYFECVGDDLRAKKGMGPGFPKLVSLKSDETAVFSFIVYKSRAHRDQVNKKVMAEMNSQDFDEKSMPFSMNKFYYGGFKTIVQA